MLTVTQVAQQLSVSKMSIYRWVKGGKLTAYKLGKQAIRISEEDLDKFINRRKIKHRRR